MESLETIETVKLILKVLREMRDDFRVVNRDDIPEGIEIYKRRRAGAQDEKENVK